MKLYRFDVRSTYFLSVERELTEAEKSKACKEFRRGFLKHCPDADCEVEMVLDNPDYEPSPEEIAVMSRKVSVLDLAVAQ